VCVCVSLSLSLSIFYNIAALGPPYIFPLPRRALGVGDFLLVVVIVEDRSRRRTRI